MIAARAPARPSAPDEASDPTLATSIDATSGITVIRIRLMKIVPTGATTASSVATAGDDEPASASPRTKPATRPISTRVVNDTDEMLTEVQSGPFWQEVCISCPAEDPMILTLVFVCLILWFLGLMTSYTLGGVLHILLVVAVILFLVHVIQGRSIGNA